MNFSKALAANALVMSASCHTSSPCLAWRPAAVKMLPSQLQRESPGQGRAECVVHLLKVLPGTRAHLRRNRVHYGNRYVAPSAELFNMLHGRICAMHVWRSFGLLL
jgi:hypothetical protein